MEPKTCDNCGTEFDPSQKVALDSSVFIKYEPVPGGDEVYHFDSPTCYNQWQEKQKQPPKTKKE